MFFHQVVSQILFTSERHQHQKKVIFWYTSGRMTHAQWSADYAGWSLGGTYREAERRGGQQLWFYLLVLLLKDVWGLLKLMFSYTLDESSFVILWQHVRRVTDNISAVVLWSQFSKIIALCSTYTEEEREDVMLDLDLELAIWGYLMLEYSLSFILFLCKVTWHEANSVYSLRLHRTLWKPCEVVPCSSGCQNTQYWPSAQT